VRSRSAALVVAAGASAAVVAASLLPWVRSGEVDRSGFALAGAARRAGLSDIRLVRAVIDAWFVLPALAAAAWTAATMRREKTAAVFSILTGAVGIGNGIAVLASHVETRAGPPASIAAGAVAMASGFWLARQGRQAHD